MTNLPNWFTNPAQAILLLAVIWMAQALVFQIVRNYRNERERICPRTEAELEHQKHLDRVEAYKTYLGKPN